ncbi:hypothetical protein Mal64_10330 [Pseudobythopirellula maris]|uniref:Tetratricopeptide repeat protein n=1 Tax=Pseudobythopirellula maris TaxID=2527991 RepID=A0A5C5ZT12_9BACT|nr:hypothetical protein [Pseudobythopirellula maris]TWT90639.1 hypothetical protein Mal64_10330 [Pseudobythopirellula maris]
MFTLRVRIILILAATTYGAYKFAYGHESAYLVLLAAPLLLWGYFRYGPMRPAFNAMNRGDFDTARQLMETVKFPKLLSAESKAYYHWVNAVLASQDPNALAYAEDEMRLALGGSIRTSHDRCLATAMLAQMVAQGDDPESAMQLLTDAEQFRHKESASVYLQEVRARIEQLSKV